ncbi:MAG: SRPBCC family protein [Thermoplasmata archaeon]
MDASSKSPPRSQATATFSYPSDRETVMTRVFRAPPAKVFKLWNDPGTIPAIWGADPSKVKIEKFEYRVGGEFPITVRGEGGDSNRFYGEFLEIVPDRRIVTSWRSSSVTDAGVVQTEEYAPVGSFTKLTIRWKRVRDDGPSRMAGPSVEALMNAQAAAFDHILELA